MTTKPELTPDDLAALQQLLPRLSAKDKAELLADLELREQHAQRARARNGLLPFAHAVYPGFKEGPHHRMLAKIFEDVIAGKKKRVIINIAPRFGKLLADDTPVLTTAGWKTHGELVPGDKVFHPSGKPIEVTHVSARAAADVRVEFFDGSVFWCHENHEWTLWNMVSRKYETVQTNYFLTPRRGRWGVTEGKNKQVLSGDRALHHLPPVAALQFAQQELPIDPYVLGAWLGDGSAGRAHITHSAQDQPYIDKIVARGYPTSGRWTHATTGVITTAFSGTCNNAGRMTRELQAAGVFTDKHIPEQYLRGSIEQRLELLAGLIDTDGHVDSNSRCSFTSVNKRLIDGVVELARSMGWRAGVSEIQPRMSSSGIQGRKVYWCAAFQPDCSIPTALARKHITHTGDKRRVGLKSVTHDPQGKRGHCITVDSPDGLYLVGRALVPTHNSEFSSYLFPAFFMGRFPDKKIIMGTHTASLSEDFGRRVKNLIDGEVYQEIFSDTQVSADQKAAGKWSTSAGGQYYAAGVGGALAGRGADLFVIDDPHALTLDTVIATPTGFKTVGEIQIGDEVFGPDGLPTKVVGKSEVWQDRPLYRVDTDDGETVWCDGGHLWNYRSDTRLSSPHRNDTARNLAQWDKDSKPCLPRHAAVQYPHKDLPIDPYVLGAWLGDGTSSLGRMTAHPDDMAFMREQFHAVGYETTTLADAYSFGVPGLRQELIDMYLLGNKHIPDMYMTASVEQRMALLQGLMDTDGNVTTAGQCSFNNTNLRLVEGVRELLHSLGSKARINVYYDTRERYNDRRPDYRVNFKLADCCRMPRKRSRTFTPTDKRCRSITVTPTDKRAAVQCITVERGDGLFLVGRGYVVTHNSEQDVKTNSRLAFDTAWSWFQTGPLQRLMPGGAIIVIMCMTGDTDVLLSDGTTRKLRDVRPGDEVATYENGGITASRITNWRSNGVDAVYQVKTRSGIRLRANERHPFLVDLDGERRWVRLRDLKPGMLLVATTATSLSATEKHLACSRAPLHTYVVTLDEIVDIQPAGREEVFDVAVERTENFIANGVVSHNTRWSKLDLTGRLIKYQIENPDADRWEIVELPPILNEGTENEKSLWPAQWPLEALKAKKAGMEPRYWNAQYMQQPTSETAAIIARGHWRTWDKPEPPKVEYVIQSWDTAHETKTTADYSACTTWGVWYEYLEDRGSPNLILLDAFKARMGFPELKATALKHYKLWEPDSVVVEKKASGAPLIQEMRAMGLPVIEFSPSRGNDKTVRLNAVADLFVSGKVWAPNTRWAQEVIEEVASFPAGDHDDYVDSCSSALLRYRQGGFISLATDDRDDNIEPREAAYY